MAGGTKAEPLRRYVQPADDDGYADEPLGSLSRWPGGRLAANGMGRIFVWSRDSGALLAVHETTAICRDGDPDIRLAFDRELGRVADGHHIRAFALWDVVTWERLATFEGHGEAVRAVAFVDGDHVLSVSGDGSIRRWDAWSGECLQAVDALPLYAMADDPARGRVAVAGGRGRVYVLDRDTLALQAEHDVPMAEARHTPLTAEQRRRIGIVWNRPSSTIRALAWHPDGEHLVCGSWDFVPKLVHARTGRCVRQWQGHAHWVDAVAIDEAGTRLVTGSSDHTVRVWDLDGETCRAVFELPSAGIDDVLVDGGEILAICGSEVVALPLV